MYRHCAVSTGRQCPTRKQHCIYMWIHHKKWVASGFMCVKCWAILEESNNLNSRHSGLIWSKQYEHSEMGGLFIPSLIVANVVIVLVFERVSNRNEKV